MKKKYWFLIMLFLALTVILSVYLITYGAPNNSTPEYLPLPERATEELQRLGVTLPEMPFNYTPVLEDMRVKESKDAFYLTRKRRITTDDIVVDESTILDVIVEADLRNPTDEYSLFFKITMSNKTDSALKNAELSVCFNPQLEYHYGTRDTYYGHRLDVLDTYSGPGIKGWRMNAYFDLPNNNPFGSPAPALKERLDIFFRDLHIITEWDGGREVYRVNPDDITFTKNIKD